MSKAPPKKENAPDAAGGGSKKKKLIIIIVLAVVLLAVAGGGAFFFLGKKKSGDKKETQKAEDPGKPPIFMSMDAFTVKLQSDAGDKYLQATISLQVPDEEQIAIMKTNMPQLRSRLLLLLSGKNAAEIMTTEGKEQLTDEITEQAKLSFAPDGPPQKILGVFFTSFVIQ